MKKKFKKIIKRESKKGIFRKDFLFFLMPNFHYLKKIKFYFLIAVTLFFLSAIVGYFNLIEKISPDLSKSLNDSIFNSIQRIMEKTRDLRGIELIGFIISNNIKTAFLGIFFGIFFGIFPLLIVLFNGYVLGFVAERAVSSSLNSIGIFVLWRLFPHGIFEIPAILIGISLGLRIGLYPFYVREKLRAFFGLILSFFIFIFLFSILLIFFVAFKNPSAFFLRGINSIDSYYESIFDNLLYRYTFIIFFVLIYIISILIGLSLLSFEDKKIVYENIFNTFKIFIYLIIPLLLFAGIIEGILISILA
ncbi:MAG: stage II sporulation protein M [Candidatus Pacearchaeota archaeon]